MKFKNYIETESGIKDTSTSPGAAGQVLSSTVTGTSWIDQSTIASGSAEVVEVPVKNLMGSELKKGDPVYISGSVGTSGRLEVKLADASDSNKMPAVGLLKQDLANNAEGFVVVTGKLRNLITSPIDGATPDPNDVIYVKPNGIAGAALTLTKPTGSSNLIQNMGKVGRVSTSNDGTFIVSSILRSNDIPNLSTGKIWVGDGNTVESTVVHLDETNGRMGIGTASPTQSLDVVGQIQMWDSGTQARLNINNTATGDSQINFQLLGTSAFAIGVDNSDSDKFKISGSGGLLGSNDRFVIDSTGNVGIGNTNPTSRLDVAGDVDATEYLIGGDAGMQRQSTHWAFGDNYGSSLGVRLVTDGQDRLSISTNGNVGIGTNSPAQKLDVAGNIAVSGTVDGVDIAAFKSAYDSHNHDDRYYTETESDNRFVNVTGDTMTGTLVLRGQTDNYDGQDRSAYWNYDNKVALALEPAADDGATAIIFKSIGNNPSDFAYIAYDEDYGEAGVAAGENGVLLISSQNDGAGSSDHVRVKGRFVVEADTSSSDPTNAFQVKASNTTTDLFRVPRAGEAYVGSNRVFHDNYHPNADKWTTGRTITIGGTGKTVDGSDNVSWTLAEIGAAASSHNHDSDYVNVGGDTMTGLLIAENGIRIGTGDHYTDGRASLTFGEGNPTGDSMYIEYDGENLSGDNNAIFIGSNKAGVGDVLAVSYGGNVGIGTTTTSGVNYAKLYVNGGIHLPSNKDISGASGLSPHIGTGNFILYSGNPGGGSEKFRITNGGNVGIGTTDPQTRLDIAGNGNAIQIRRSNGYASIKAHSDNSGHLILDSNSSSGAVFLQNYVGGNVYMVTGGGNVGIGTDDPSEKLEVNGGQIQINDTGTQARLNINNTGTGDPQINFQLSGTTKFTVGVDNSDSDKFKISNASFLGGSDRIVIDSFGKVGIGTASPDSKLRVEGDFNISGKYIYNQGVTSTSGAGVPSGIYLDWKSGQTTLNSAYNYRVRLTTGGTGTNSGSTYLVEYNPDTTSWNTRMVSRSGSTSNHPLLAVSSSTMVAYTNHATPYQIQYHVESISVSDNDGTLHNMGADYHWQRDVDSLYYTDGNVGIGTTSPTGKLHVAGNTKITGSTTIGDATSGTIQSINGNSELTLYQSGGWIIGDIYSTGSYVEGFALGGVDIKTNASSRIKVLQNGNVGIGTTSPVAKLDVNGAGNFSGGTVVSGIDTNTNVGLAIAKGDYLYSNDGNYLRRLIGQQSGGSIDIGQQGTGLIGNINFFPGTSGNIIFYASGSENMRVASSGNVGIGTTSPTSAKFVISGVSTAAYAVDANGKLKIKGDGTLWWGSTADYGKLTWDTGKAIVRGESGKALSLGANGTQDTIYITTSQNVGIGTTSPSQKLHVVGNITVSGTGSFGSTVDAASPNINNWIFKATNSDFASESGFYDANNHVEMILRNSSDTIAAHIKSSGSSYFNGGNVGIGTTGPSTKLHVNGNTYVQNDIRIGSSFGATNQTGIIKEGGTSYGLGFFTWGDTAPIQIGGGHTIIKKESGGNANLYVTGNVGIGTTNPSEKLHVNGNIKFAGSTNKLLSSNGYAHLTFDSIGGFTLGDPDYNYSGTFIKSDQDNYSIELETDGTTMMKAYSTVIDIPRYMRHLGDTNTFFGFPSTDRFLVATAGSTRMFFDPSGNMGLGTTSPSYQLQLSLNSAAKPTSSTWTVVSDERVKTNIRSYETGLKEILQVNPKVFDYNGKAGFDPNVKDNIGVIAQEIKDVIPETVKKYKAKLNDLDAEDTELYNFDSHALTFALINSVKELNKKIEELQNEIQTLKQNG